MKKRILALIAVATTLLFSLSACQSSAAPSAASKGSEQSSPADTATSGEPVTITFDQFSASGDNLPFLQQMIDAYTAENPHVTIQMQSYGYDDYFTQLTAKMSAGQAADVFELNYENFVTYARKGSLAPLDKIIASEGIDTSVYNQTALSAFNTDNVQYGVPNSFSNVVLIYNKDLFDQAKIEYPTSSWKWADAMEAAKAIRALDDKTFGYYQPLSFFEFYKVTKQNGGGLMTEDGSAFTINTPENLEVLQYMLDMENKLNVMPTAEQMERLPSADWDLFKSGRLGMIVTGIWAFPDFTRDCDFAWDIAMEPGNVENATHFFSNAYVVKKDSATAAEAAKFITFISSNRAATQIRLDAAWELPPVNDADIIAQYKEKTPPENRAAVFESLEFLVTPPVVTQFAELQDIVNRHLEAAAAGTVSAEQALADMQAECEEKIDLSK